jgi:hypothetical protein
MILRNKDNCLSNQLKMAFPGVFPRTVFLHENLPVKPRHPYGMKFPRVSGLTLFSMRDDVGIPDNIQVI